jgi:DNA polymerase-1
MTQPQNNPAAPQDLFLIDGSGFIFRAFHALPPLTRPDGTPVGAVLGFCNMLLKLLTDHPDARVAVIFDAARKNFRYDIYPEYKANRSETPPDLIPQFPLIREAAAAFGLPGIELEGFEADDLIATYAKHAEAQGIPVTIVSSDKDLMQLVRDGVRMMDPIKQSFIGPEEVFEKFGVTPDKVVYIQALAGDATDNVPGVPSIGVKTAAQLITEYGDLETLLASTAKIKQPKRREVLEQHAEDARISLKLVTLDDNVAVPASLESLKPDHPFSERLNAFLEQQGFKSLLTRVSNRSSSNSLGKPALTAPHSPASAPLAQPPSPAIATESYDLVVTEDALQKWIALIYETGVCAFDTETTGLTPALADLVGISLSPRAGLACYIPLAHGQKTDLLSEPTSAEAQIPIQRVIELLKPMLEDPSILKIAHNVKYDLQMFLKEGIAVAPVDDTMLISYVLDGTGHAHGLDQMALTYCDHQMISYDDVTGTGKKRISFSAVPLDKACNYAAEDADYTKRIYDIFHPRLALEKMSAMYEDIERPLAPIIAGMEFAGIRVDSDVLKQLSKVFGERIAEAETSIQKEAGRPFNVGSPKQLGVVLFDEMGLPGGTKTKTGDWSTSVDILEDLAAQGHVFVEKILEWRQLSKLKSTYTEALQNAINPATGRVHTSYSMAATSTGRLSSSDPNLQNIPIRTEEGRMIRRAFIAEPGHMLLSVDYSQIELRLAAEMANVETLKQAFRNGDDIHAITASKVFNVPLSEMTPEIRRQAKAINFGIIYGMSGYGLASQIGVTPGEANTFIKQYFARFPELGAFMEETKVYAREHGYVKTLFGRKCVIPGIADKNGARRSGAERQAINAPLQGTAADLIKLAMVRIDRAIRNEGLPALMLLQVHDELVFEVPETEVKAVSERIKAEMEAVATFSIPLEASAGTGFNWADAH